jgi:hypothetical protein
MNRIIIHIKLSHEIRWLISNILEIIINIKIVTDGKAYDYDGISSSHFQDY